MLLLCRTAPSEKQKAELLSRAVFSVHWEAQTVIPRVRVTAWRPTSDRFLWARSSSHEAEYNPPTPDPPWHPEAPPLQASLPLPSQTMWGQREKLGEFTLDFTPLATVLLALHLLDALSRWAAGGVGVRTVVTVDARRHSLLNLSVFTKQLWTWQISQLSCTDSFGILTFKI